MDTMWEKIKKSLRDGASLSMEKIEEYTKVGKLKIEEMAARRKIERNHMDIGERVCDLLNEKRSGEIEGDLAVKKAIENIVSLKEDIEEIEGKIRKVQEEVRSARGEGGEEDEEISGI